MGQLRAHLGPTWVRLRASWSQHGPTWGQLGGNLGSTWTNLRPTGADMQQLGVNLGPTRANMVARGQLGVKMYFVKPEKLVFRLDVRSWARLGWTSGEALGTPWEALGTPWRIFLEDLGKTLRESPRRHLRIHVAAPNSFFLIGGREAPLL